MIRGVEGPNLFSGDEERGDFLSRVRELSLDTGTRILPWALMDEQFGPRRGLSKVEKTLGDGGNWRGED